MRRRVTRLVDRREIRSLKGRVRTASRKQDTSGGDRSRRVSESIDRGRMARIESNFKWRRPSGGTDTSHCCSTLSSRLDLVFPGHLISLLNPQVGVLPNFTSSSSDPLLLTPTRRRRVLVSVVSQIRFRTISYLVFHLTQKFVDPQ